MFDVIDTGQQKAETAIATADLKSRRGRRHRWPPRWISGSPARRPQSSMNSVRRPGFGGVLTLRLRLARDGPRPARDRAKTGASCAGMAPGASLARSPMAASLIHPNMDTWPLPAGRGGTVLIADYPELYRGAGESPTTSIRSAIRCSPAPIARLRSNRAGRRRQRTCRDRAFRQQWYSVFQPRGAELGQCPIGALG